MDGAFVDELDPDAQSALAELGRNRHYEAGAPLFLAGTASATIFVVRAGRVKIAAASEDGLEVVLAIRGPGDVLGDLAAIDGRPHSASGTALERVEAQVIPADAFRTFLRDVPGAGLALLRVVSARVRDSDRRRLEFGAYDTLTRVAIALIDLAQTYGEPDEYGIRIAVPLSQNDLSGIVAASREAVARALASLRRRGLITTARRQITITNLALLHDAATR